MNDYLKGLIEKKRSSFMTMFGDGAKYLNHRIAEELMKEEKYHEEVYCLKTPMNGMYMRGNAPSLAEAIYTCNGIQPFSRLESVLNLNSFLFSAWAPDNTPFFYYKDTDVKSRFNLEYNPEYRQISVGVLITNSDRSKYLMLKTKSGSDTRIQEKITLVQGHASFATEDLTKSFIEAMQRNVIKEMTEELNIPEEIKQYIEISTEPKYTINITTDIVSLEHVGIIFEFRLPEGIDLENCGITSGEPEKHDVVVQTIEEFKQTGKLDSWSGNLFNRILDDEINELTSFVSESVATQEAVKQQVTVSIEKDREKGISRGVTAPGSITGFVMDSIDEPEKDMKD